ncbi:hypothetical protein FGB62_22g62 [Gracilaria domingensis]|nr:hypothetical protein FGB62_22g62 [Gracilaria domingensis]
MRNTKSITVKLTWLEGWRYFHITPALFRLGTRRAQRRSGIAVSALSNRALRAAKLHHKPRRSKPPSQPQRRDRRRARRRQSASQTAAKQTAIVTAAPRSSSCRKPQRLTPHPRRKSWHPQAATHCRTLSHSAVNRRSAASSYALKRICAANRGNANCDHASSQRRQRSEAPKLEKTGCNVLFHYFFFADVSGEYLSYVVVVGVGVHDHTWPVRRPPSTALRNFVSNLYKEGKQITDNQVLRRIENRFGSLPSPYTVHWLKTRVQKEKYPLGKSLRSLSTIINLEDQYAGNDRYILSFKDNRIDDHHLPKKNQKGVSIIFGRAELLDMAAENPRLGCDGTFGIVSSLADDLNFELVTIVAKNERTGKIFAVMRQLTSRKTMATRSILFHELVRQLTNRGMKDPLKESPEKRLTMATDFETTYSFALGTVLSEYVGSGTALEYIAAIGLGCDVHAKRIVLEKCDARNEPELFSWAVGTRFVDTESECKEVLSIMQGLGGKWKSFANWLATNKCAYLLWFQNNSSTIPVSIRAVRAFLDTNVNESYHNRIKSSPMFALRHEKGLQLMAAIAELKIIDLDDVRNFGKSTVFDGSQLLLLPQWRTCTPKKGKKRFTEVIDIDNEDVSASQPRTAKKSRSRKPVTVNRNTEKKIENLQQTVDRLHEMIVSLINKTK